MIPTDERRRNRLKMLLEDVIVRASSALAHFDQAPGQFHDNCACIELASTEIVNILEDK